MYKNCLNCFTQLGADGVCPRCGFDNSAYKPESHHMPPETILHGRYMTGKAMGEGGFGITYSGYDLVLKRKVAIKEYFPAGVVWRDPAKSLTVSCYTTNNYTETFNAGRQKCIQEAQFLAKLDDIPAIVRILDFFPENGTAYIIMEFVEGVTLKEYLKRQTKRLTLPEILDLLEPVTAALDKVHKRGFVHRDISPDNIMITHDGAAKLLDFGAVKSVSSSGSATEHPVVKRGFSPLELYSTSGLIGTWTDVYSLAATIYYMLTGSVLDEPTDRIQNDTVEEKLSGVLTQEQTTAMMNALAVPQKARHSSVSDFINTLRAQASEANNEVQPGNEEKSIDNLGDTVSVEDAEIVRKNAVYDYAVGQMATGSPDAIRATIPMFESIIDWKDSREKLEECRKMTGTAYTAGGEDAKKGITQDRKKLIKFSAIGVAAVLVLVLIIGISGPKRKYNEACDYLNSGNYSKAIELFEELGDYKDSPDMILEVKYQQAKYWLSIGHYSDAMNKFDEISYYKDSKTMITECKYQYVKNNLSNKNNTTFTYLKELKDMSYKDSDDIYEDLYSWKIELVACNTNSNDYTTINKTISKYCSCFHSYFKLSGGTPGEKITLTDTAVFPDGSQYPWSGQWQNLSDGSTFDAYWPNGLYTNPSPSVKGTLTIKIYNADTSKFMQSFSVTII